MIEFNWDEFVNKMKSYRLEIIGGDTEGWFLKNKHDIIFYIDTVNTPFINKEDKIA